MVYPLFLVIISNLFTLTIIKIRDNEFKLFRTHTLILLNNINDKFDIFDKNIENKTLLELNDEINQSFNYDSDDS